MLDAVFISDLHLHPDEPLLNQRFHNFIHWAKSNTKSVYILGDFFHVWPGDDGMTPWSADIAKQLHSLSEQQIPVYFMHGNRDFLLGPTFATYAGISILPDPSMIQLDQATLLTHGDRYCTDDKAHQRLRRLTRNRLFPKLFLSLSFTCRNNMVNKLRQHSQLNKSMASFMDIVVSSMIKDLQKKKVNVLIHGHIHKPGLTHHQKDKKDYFQYVLSDWDDKPSILCYKNKEGFKYIHIEQT